MTDSAWFTPELVVTLTNLYSAFHTFVSVTDSDWFTPELVLILIIIKSQTIENLSTREEDSLAEMGELTDEEIERVSQDNFYDLLAYSIAPEIYGHTVGIRYRGTIID